MISAAAKYATNAGNAGGIHPGTVSFITSAIARKAATPWRRIRLKRRMPRRRSLGSAFR
jgi:hypothetical protein